MLRLQISRRGTFERELVVTDQQLVIGRGGTHCGLCLPSTSVSRRHARLFLDGEAYWIEDLGSTNGTTINGKRIQKSRLKEGDVVKIGDRELRVLQSESEAGISAADEKLEEVLVDSAPEEGEGVFEEGSLPSVSDSAAPTTAPAGDRVLVLHFLDGPHEGHKVVLGKNLVSIGRAGDVMAAIAWRPAVGPPALGPYSLAGVAPRPAGHYLVPLGGKGFPSLNGKEVNKGGEVIKPGDLIAVGKLRVEVRKGEQSAKDL